MAITFLQGLAAVGAAVGIVGAVKSGLDAKSAGKASSANAAFNAVAVLELAEANAEQVDANIVTIKQSRDLTKREFENTAVETRIKAEFNREEIGLSASQAIETARLRRAQINRQTEKTVAIARARGGASGITSNTGSVQDVVTGVNVDSGLNISDINLAELQTIQTLSLAERQNNFSLESALLQIQRDLLILDYNTEITIRTEERRKEIIFLEAQTGALNFGSAGSRAKQAASAASTAQGFRAASGALDFIEALNTD